MEHQDLSFEKTMERFEEIVKRLEQGKLPLEESLALFEDGVGLARRAEQTLIDAERRIEVVLSAGRDGLEKGAFPAEPEGIGAPGQAVRS